MLAAVGIIMILVLLLAIMSKRLSALVALIVIPLLAGLVAGFGLELFEFMTEGIKSIAATGVMFIFAILFFGILTDAGTFKPIIRVLLRYAGEDPARVALASALLAMLVHLDGSGAVTFLVAIPALLPLYDALKLPRTMLATIVAIAAGTMNILPWGGPTIRAASALDISVSSLFQPLLIPVASGLLGVLIIAYLMGKKYRGRQNPGSISVETHTAENEEDTALERPKLFLINVLLIIISVTILISGIVPPHLVFMLAFALAISINYPNLKEQTRRINAHAEAALLMAGILFAAGCFTGILKESGMLSAMSAAAVNYIPLWVGQHMASITGLLSMPASLIFDPDSFYFGILPLLSETATHFDGEAIEVGRAALLGQMTTGFPVSPLTGSTYLLVGLAGVDLGDHQRKTIPYAFLITCIMLVVAILMGTVSL